MSAHRLPLDTASGGFATLTVMIPWKALQAAGLPEGSAASIAGGLLSLAALAALAFRSAPFAQRQYHVKVYNEVFRLRQFLQSFALFAFAELALVAIILAFLSANPS